MNFLGKKLDFIVAQFFLEKYKIYLHKFLDHEIKGIDFNLGDGTEAYFACTTVFEGETLVLGGKREYNQFSKVESCGLKRTNTLPFTENLYAQVYCGTYTLKRSFWHGNEDETAELRMRTFEVALICRHQQCFT